MKLEEFVDLFTVALYHHTELHDATYVRASTILDLYGLPFKNSWESLIFDDYDFSTRVSSSRNIGRFGQQSIRISAEGVRWVEDTIGDDNVAAFLEQHGVKNPEESDKAALDEVETIEAQLIPASDRVVAIGDNLPKRSDIVAQISNAEEAIRSSNEMDADDKADAILSLSLGRKLIEGCKRVVVGVVRYLILDRIKKAFERTIEDVFRVALVAAFVTIGTIILALL
jgi:hypothetical protein